MVGNLGTSSAIYYTVGRVALLPRQVLGVVLDTQNLRYTGTPFQRVASSPKSTVLPTASKKQPLGVAETGRSRLLLESLRDPIE
jgi:hypothetical protein